MKNIGLALSLVLLSLIVIFSIQNAEELQVRFLFWCITTRRVFILFGALVIGIVLGWVIRAYADAGKKNRPEKPTADGF